MRIFLLAVAVVLSFGSLLRADPPDARKRFEQMRKQFMEKIDKNKDGKIDKAEKKAIREEFAKRRGEFAKRRGEHDRGHHGHGRPEPKKETAKKEGHKDSSPRAQWAQRIAEHKKEFMAKYDKNNNGKIDDDEKEAIGKAFQERVAKGTEMLSGAIVGGLDKSEDGKLNVDEVPERLREHFGEADRNKDGYVDKAEVKKAIDRAREKLQAHLKQRIEEHRKRHAGEGKRPEVKQQGPSRAEALFKRIMSGDKNKDGKLNADEIPEGLRRRFAAMDANGDGYVDAGELKKVVAGLLKR